jgi:hypothetical protein
MGDVEGGASAIGILEVYSDQRPLPRLCKDGYKGTDHAKYDACSYRCNGR